MGRDVDLRQGGDPMSTQMRSMFTITEDLQAIHAALVDASGELTPEIEAALNALTMEFGDKIDAYGYKIRALDAQADLHRDRAAYHELRARAFTRMVEELKSRLLTAMIALGRKKLEGEDFTASVRESQAVDLFDPSKLPAEFWRTKEPEPAKDAIKKMLIGGQAVPGARLETRQFVVLK